MALLIQMRQRIKAIKTIKKITHAMRLISMSNHSRLKSKENPLKGYTDGLNELFHTLKAQNPSWHNPLLFPINEHKKTLIILVGSQKGLCGNFNAALFRHFELSLSHENLGLVDYIGVGKKAVDYLADHMNNHQQGTILKRYSEFSTKTLFEICQQLTSVIMDAQNPYTNVFIASNKHKTFFMQKPQIFSLIPFTPSSQPEKVTSTQDYQWEQDPLQLLDALALQCLEATIQTILFQSLLSEQAARFISMDGSTRNAQGLLETTELQYNKLRQAKITKELTELTGSF